MRKFPGFYLSMIGYYYYYYVKFLDVLHSRRHECIMTKYIMIEIKKLRYFIHNCRNKYLIL